MTRNASQRLLTRWSATTPDKAHTLQLPTPSFVMHHLPYNMHTSVPTVQCNSCTEEMCHSVITWVGRANWEENFQTPSDRVFPVPQSAAAEASWDIHNKHRNPPTSCCGHHSAERMKLASSPQDVVTLSTHHASF